ncbi:hypothetical protein AVEN_158308-1 [Araneus ventricosus]|uniref:Uncharacterized protein n=1 Tax=Araneus ventricosus TaxID=182803 RepID=A0A4Y2IEJ7_ARAVE|nr:hypothetical protein AVEN_158308-1 [Araneus ventricosus]
MATIDYLLTPGLLRRPFRWFLPLHRNLLLEKTACSKFSLDSSTSIIIQSYNESWAEKKLPAWAQTIKCMLDGSDRNVQVVKEMLVLVILPVQFSEHQLALTYPPTVTENFAEEGSASPHLRIVGFETNTSKFYVLAEHQIVLQLSTLSEALAVLVASYYIFHCEYPRQ